MVAKAALLRFLDGLPVVTAQVSSPKCYNSVDAVDRGLTILSDHVKLKDTHLPPTPTHTFDFIRLLLLLDYEILENAQRDDHVDLI